MLLKQDFGWEEMQPVNQDSVTFDEMLDAIGDVQRRRLLIDLISDNPDYRVNAVLKDAPEGSESRRRRYIELLHIHLPKLEKYGLITWDRDSNEVGRGLAFEQVRPIVELLHARREQLPEGWV